MIRDALVEEVKARADAETRKAKELEDTIKEREAALAALDSEKQGKEGEIETLKSRVAEEESRSKAAIEKIAAQGAEISELKLKWQAREESGKRRVALAAYIGLLAAVILIAGIVGWWAERRWPSFAMIIGTATTRALFAIIIFVLGHLLLEWWARGKQQMMQLWPFRQVSRFRGWLWTLVILSFVLGVIGNLVANRIQRNLDNQQESSLSTPPSSMERVSTSPSSNTPR